MTERATIGEFRVEAVADLVSLAGAGAWQAEPVTTPDLTLVADWLSLSEVARLLDVPPSKVRQLVREHQLAAARPDGRGEIAVPADFLCDGLIVKGLPGTLTVLSDRGLGGDEAIEWLFTPDDTLPGRPIDALREDRGKEVRRRAQVIV